MTNDVSQPLYSEYVQKLASEVISLTKRKIGRAIFVWLFLLLDAGQLFHNLFIKIKLSYAIRNEGSIQVSIRSPIRLLLMQMDFDR
ncbi:hypothetical protein CTI32_02755 [Enterococcus faecium]|nr:hypothetical protein CTI32_02755 [Enterococcus faecium]EGP5363948.1 hypothetical protein [Enterococcus faecium]EGP5537200.1 hypothetical protein [Enterococcus faecium]TNW69871.1 hypothetical protein FIU61_10610 [Enterococcus faecium]